MKERTVFTPHTFRYPRDYLCIQGIDFVYFRSDMFRILRVAGYIIKECVAALVSLLIVEQAEISL